MRYFLSLLLLILFSCQKNIEQKDINQLNGYWEIEKVELPDGSSKKYQINESIDYFEINDSLKGFRAKVIFQLDGKLLTNGLKENVEVISKGDLFFLSYVTKYADWKEEVVVLNQKKLILKNEQGITYFYKRKGVDNE